METHKPTTANNKVLQNENLTFFLKNKLDLEFLIRDGKKFMFLTFYVINSESGGSIFLKNNHHWFY